MARLSLLLIVALVAFAAAAEKSKQTTRPPAVSSDGTRTAPPTGKKTLSPTFKMIADGNRPPPTKKCGKGEEYDTMKGKCVAVSCDAKEPCEVGQLCVKKDVKCVRSPCPQFVCVKPCHMDLKICPDGSSVGRDSKNNCEFPECPKGCTKDAKICPDGSTVSRDIKIDCQFPDCPKMPTTCKACVEKKLKWQGRCSKDCDIMDVACYGDIKGCKKAELYKEMTKKCTTLKGCKSCVGHNTKLCYYDSNKGACFMGANMWSMPTGIIRPGQKCVEMPKCTMDVKICPDKSTVSRDPENNCQFPPCPTPATEAPTRRQDGNLTPPPTKYWCVWLEQIWLEVSSNSFTTFSNF
jgi:hypothetical protein